MDLSIWQRAYRRYVYQYWWHYRHCMSWNINDMHCELGVCIQFGWIAIILYKIKCRENPEKKSRDWLDIAHGFSGHCPWSQWILYKDWVDIVHGYCPWTEWTLSMDSVDISMDTVDIVHGPSFQYFMDFLQCHHHFQRRYQSGQDFSEMNNDADLIFTAMWQEMIGFSNTANLFDWVVDHTAT